MNKKEMAQKYMADYISGKVDLSPFYDESLIEELKNYTPKSDKEYMGHKALRIYAKCCRHKKFVLAMKIDLKYGHLFPNSDMCDAFAVALFNNKNS